MPSPRVLLFALLFAGALLACTGTGDPLTDGPDPAPAPAETALPPTSTPTPAPDPGDRDEEPPASPTPHVVPEGPTPTPAEAAIASRPDWLGTLELPRRPDGFGEVQPTPPELVDRRLPPPPGGLPPPSGDAFESTVTPVPDDVVARSTWSPECPVDLDELRYVIVSFHGFDGRSHTGELLVHARAADDLVEVFRRIYEAEFPIEEMRVVDEPELDAPPTGDGNNTTAFVCRPVRGAQRWSEHAFGLAVDINPFHNPFERGDVVLPELASAYLDRDAHRPGMIQRGDVVTTAFADIGWGWGGDWRSLKDWMHFSESGR